MKWIDNPKQIFKHISFICMTLFSSGIFIFSQLPERLQSALSDHGALYYSSALIFIGIIGKFVDQFNDDSKND